jgi:hypothetical protein
MGVWWWDGSLDAISSLWGLEAVLAALLSLRLHQGSNTRCLDMPAARCTGRAAAARLVCWHRDGGSWGAFVLLLELAQVARVSACRAILSEFARPLRDCWGILVRARGAEVGVGHARRGMLCMC